MSAAAQPPAGHRLAAAMKQGAAAASPGLVTASPSSASPQSPRSPRGRLRRGQSPPQQQQQLTVLIDPPSLEAADLDAGGRVDSDSLSLAMEELLGTATGRRPAANFLEAHERATRCGNNAGAASPAVDCVANGGGGACADGGSSGSRSDDDFLGVRPAAKRSSSLRSKKTPPGTPSQVKKAVRFADAFGLDLANVKHVLDPEDPPEIPAQATRDLELDDDEPEEAGDVDGSRPPVAPSVRPSFSQPGQSAGFGARVMAQKVVLEFASCAPPPAAELRGYVRVANLAFEKSVSVRGTFDGWRSSTEVGAAYVPNSSSGMTDQFFFCLALPAGVARVAFCVAYRVGGQTYWDNNFGENYAFEWAAGGGGGGGGSASADAWGRRC